MESKKEVYASANAAGGPVRAFATDDPAKGGDGACHHYRVTHKPSVDGPEIDLGVIKFQNGLPADVGVNGVSDEALLSVIADHLEGFQLGVCNCQANRQAAQHVREAISWLSSRTPAQRGATPPKGDSQ